jgi:hypothetical protein
MHLAGERNMLLFVSTQGKPAAGVNLHGCTLADSNHVLQDCDYNNLRIFISHHVPCGLLRLAPQLMWIGSLSHTHADICQMKLAAPLPASTGACLQELVVLDLQVSRSRQIPHQHKHPPVHQRRWDLCSLTLHDCPLQLS